MNQQEILENSKRVIALANQLSKAPIDNGKRAKRMDIRLVTIWLRKKANKDRKMRFEYRLRFPDHIMTAQVNNYPKEDVRNINNDMDYIYLTKFVEATISQAKEADAELEKILWLGDDKKR